VPSSDHRRGRRPIAGVARRRIVAVRFTEDEWTDIGNASPNQNRSDFIRLSALDAAHEELEGRKISRLARRS
jgi:hypothetical protein